MIWEIELWVRRSHTARPLGGLEGKLTGQV